MQCLRIPTFFASYLGSHCIEVPLKRSFLFNGPKKLVPLSKSPTYPGSHLTGVYCNNDNPSINSDILVYLSDIRGDINSIKTTIEDAFARTFNFFKRKKSQENVRNLICEINFLKNIIGRNYSNVSWQVSLRDDTNQL